MSLAPQALAQAAPTLIAIFVLAYAAIALEHPSKSTNLALPWLALA